MTSTQYQEWKEFLNSEPSRRVISEAILSLPGSCILTSWVAGFFYLRATFTYCVGTLWRLIHLRATWNVKCAGKQISVMEAQRAVTVLLAGCSGESTCSSLVTRNSLPCHSSENTSGQKGRGLGHWLFFPTHSGKYSVAASPSRCRWLPCPYSRSGLELCINFSLVHAWASLPKVLLAEVGASCICRVANQTNLTLKQNRGWSTWLHRCSPYIMFPLIIEFWFVGLVDSLKKRKV